MEINLNLQYFNKSYFFHHHSFLFLSALFIAFFIQQRDRDLCKKNYLHVNNISKNQIRMKKLHLWHHIKIKRIEIRVEKSC